MKKIVAILFFICFAGYISAQQTKVIVFLKQAAPVNGELIKLDAKGVELNPDGNISFRFIKSELIDSVFIQGIGKTIIYPMTKDLDTAIVSKDYLDYEQNVSQSVSSGNKNFIIYAGAGYFNTDGDYFSGFNSGPGLNIGMNYYLRSLFPGTNLLIGLEFSKGWISGDPLRVWNNNNISEIETSLGITMYSIHLGRAWSLSSSNSDFHILLGLTILDNEVIFKGGDESITTSQSKTAIKLGAGFLIDISESLFINLNMNYDAILGKKEKKETFMNFYDPNEPKFTFLGGVMRITVEFGFTF